jgi:hypothetical protein
MPEWGKIIEAGILPLAEGLGTVEVCSSIEMGAPGASHLEMGDHGPKTD